MISILLGDFKTNLENRDEIPSGFETAYNDMSGRFVTTPQQQHQPSTTHIIEHQIIK